MFMSFVFFMCACFFTLGAVTAGTNFLRAKEETGWEMILAFALCLFAACVFFIISLTGSYTI